jgi:hypothetical protein
LISLFLPTEEKTGEIGSKGYVDLPDWRSWSNEARGPPLLVDLAAAAERKCVRRHVRMGGAVTGRGHRTAASVAEKLQAFGCDEVVAGILL